MTRSPFSRLRPCIRARSSFSVEAKSLPFQTSILMDGLSGSLGAHQDDLAGGEAEGLRSGSPPPAGRLPGLGRVDVVAAGDVPGGGLALGLPDVAEVVALGDGDDHGQPAASFPVTRRGTDHDHLDECNGLRRYEPW